MFVSSQGTMRERYLRALLSRYGTLTLPLNVRSNEIALNAVFQPLALRHQAVSFGGEKQGSQIDVAQDDEDEAWPPSLQRQSMTARNGTEALEKSPSRCLIILGGPGMGKTTLLKDLLQQAIRTALSDAMAALPVFISLPDLARSGLTLANYLPRLLAELEIEASFASDLHTAIMGGRGFLCLDSLDEVLPDLRPDIIAFIRREATHSGGTWIVGSRFTEYQGGQFSSSHFAEWTLLPLDISLRRQLAAHLLPLLGRLLHRASPTVEAFLQALAQDQRIAEWGENPLLFSLAAVVYVQRGMFPVNRSALYATIIDVMLGLRFADPAQRETLRVQLARVALDLYQTKGRNFTAQDLSDLLRLYEPHDNPREGYEQVARILDSGILDVIAYQTYGFKHQMFQEYLAAVELARQLLNPDEQVSRAAWDFVRRKRTYSRWREILRLLVGVLVQEHGEAGSRLAADWLQHLADAHLTEDGDPGHLSLLLALNSLQEFPMTAYTPQMIQATRALVIVWARTYFDTLELHRSHHYQSEAENTRWTDIKHTATRMEQALEDIRRLDIALVIPAIDTLERAFEEAKLRDVEDRTEKEFYELLDKLVLSIPARVLALAFGEQSHVDLYTLTTAKRLEAQIAIEPLLALLEDQHEHWRARAGAARLLARVDSQPVHSILARLLADPACFYRVRVVAAEALGWQGGARAVVALTRAAQDTDERIHVAAVEAMGMLGADMPVQALLAALKDTRNVRNAAHEALEQLDTEASLEPLLVALHDKDAGVRMDVLQVLATIQQHSQRVPVESIINLLYDFDYEVRRVAVHTVAHFADVTVLLPLLDALRDDTPDLEQNIAAEASRALIQLGEKQPDLWEWVRAEHLERAVQDGWANIIRLHSISRTFISVFNLLDFAVALHLRLSSEMVLSIFAEGWGGAEEQMLHILAPLGLDLLGPETFVAHLLDMLHTLPYEAQRNIAKALVHLYPYVPTDSIIAWRQRIEPEITAKELSYSTRSDVIEVYVCLSELLLYQGREIDINRLLSIWEDASKFDGRTSGITRVFNALQEKAPLARLLGILYDKRQVETIASIVRHLYTLLTPELIVAEARHRYKDEILAVEVLAAMQADAPIDLLMSILADPTRDRSVRVRALFNLSELEASVPLEYFVLGQEWCIIGVDRHMIETMTRLREHAPIPELVELLGHHSNWVRRSAMQSLQKLAEYAPIDLLLPVLESKDVAMREGAVNTCSAFGERAPLEKLRSMVANKREHWSVRWAALMTLTKLGARVPVDLLLELIQTSDGNLRHAAFSAFAAMGRDAPLEILLGLLDNDALRRNALETLGALEEKAPVELLLQFLDSDRREDQRGALQALTMLGKYAPIEEMRARLYNKDGEMRGELISVFGGMGNYAPVDLILMALDSDDGGIREAANMALFMLSEHAPARLVAEARDDPRPAVRRRVLHALRKLGQDAPVEIALAALDDKEVRGSALSALAELNVDISTIMPLDTFLQKLHADGGTDTYSWSALTLLAQFGAQVPLELFLPSLNAGSLTPDEAKKLYKTHPEVFREMVVPQAEAMLRGEPVGGVFAAYAERRIAQAIGQIGRATPEVLALVVDLLDRPDKQTRLEAVRALGAIHRNIPDRAIRRLLKLRHDRQSREVCEAADVALAKILAYENGMEEEASSQ